MKKYIVLLIIIIALISCEISSQYETKEVIVVNEFDLIEVTTYINYDNRAVIEFKNTSDLLIIQVDYKIDGYYNNLYYYFVPNDEIVIIDNLHGYIQHTIEITDIIIY